MNYEMLNKVANYFQVSVDELLGREKPSEFFSDSRIPKTEVQDLFDSMTPQQQARTLAYMQGIVDANEVQERLASDKPIRK